MTRDQIQAALAEAIRDAIDNVHDINVAHDDYARAGAAAVMALVGPKPLVWNCDGAPIASPTPYQIWGDNGGSGAPDDPSEKFENYRVFEPIGMCSISHNGTDQFPTIEAAQAAAQAHADAAHWANTAIGKLMGRQNENAR